MREGTKHCGADLLPPAITQEHVPKILHAAQSFGQATTSKRSARCALEARKACLDLLLAVDALASKKQFLGWKVVPDNPENVDLAAFVIKMFLNVYVWRDGKSYPTVENSPQWSLWRTLAWAVAWAQSGYPMVSLTDKQAAAFAFSDVDCDAIDVERLPWGCFAIVIPEGAVPSNGGYVWRITGMRSAHVGDSEVMISYRADLKNSKYNALWIRDVSLREMVRQAATDSSGDGVGVHDLDDTDRMANRACIRIMLNALAAFPGYGERRRALGSARRRRRHKGADFSAYGKNDFVIGMPITIDARDELRDFVSGNRAAERKVRWIVRGHWRRQPHGKDRALRRMTFIQPHWAGRRDAPINVREHRMAE